MPILGKRRAVWVARRSGCECQLSVGRARLNDAEQARSPKCYFARSVRALRPGRFAFHSSMVSGNGPCPTGTTRGANVESSRKVGQTRFSTVVHTGLATRSDTAIWASATAAWTG